VFKEKCHAQSETMVIGQKVTETKKVKKSLKKKTSVENGN
jgi:hypothetical protein